MSSDQIILDNRGVAWIAGANVKVVEVVLDHVQGQSPEQIHENHPNLALAQIRAALAYYSEHPLEIDALIRQGQERYEAGYAKPENQAWREKMLLRAAAGQAALKEEAAA